MTFLKIERKRKKQKKGQKNKLKTNPIKKKKRITTLVHQNQTDPIVEMKLIPERCTEKGLREDLLLLILDDPIRGKQIHIGLMLQLLESLPRDLPEKVILIRIKAPLMTFQNRLEN